MYMTMALGNTMVSANMQKLQMKVLMVLAVVNIILNYSLISYFDCPALPWSGYNAVADA